MSVSYPQIPLISVFSSYDPFYPPLLSPCFSLSSFPFLLIFSVPALLLSLLQYLIPYPNHHLPLLFPFSPFFFSSSPLISPLFFSSSNHSYPSFSFLPALIISSSLLRYPISPFLSSASLIVPSIALFLSPSYLVLFIAFSFKYALILSPFPFLLPSLLGFSCLSFHSSYFSPLYPLSLPSNLSPLLPVSGLAVLSCSFPPLSLSTMSSLILCKLLPPLFSQHTRTFPSNTLLSPRFGMPCSSECYWKVIHPFLCLLAPLLHRI